MRFPLQVVLAVALSFGAVGTAMADDVIGFFTAVQVDSERAVKKAIASGIDPNVRDPRSGETALIIAMREDSMNVFKALLADPRTQLELAAPNGNTALMMAAYKRNKEAVLALLAKGAKVNRAGWSPLHYAAAGGADDIARILLKRGAALDALAPGDLTPLMLAAREGQDSAVSLLLEAGANASLKSGEGLTAMQIAARADKPLIVAILCDRSPAR
ncbi:ankyrin repeat domain-containing protein [Massilia cavernae]|uniref:Ankyrin repeat domain-containing protein n=2 Tax=Massilia cavernae TaxID=2320864 RepID=A0A418XDW5_9BURK|nr:ankyrin repeat domain-containing protein [Massilia cavernae]